MPNWAAGSGGGGSTNLNSAIAKSVGKIDKSNVDWAKGAAKSIASGEHHSNWFSKILETIDLPRAAVVALLHQGIHNPAKAFETALNPVGAAVTEGATNPSYLKDVKNHIGFGDIVHEAGIDNKWAARGLGFVGDVALDPLTYLTFGSGKAAEMGSQGLLHTVGEMAAKKEIPEITADTFARIARKGSAGLKDSERAVLVEHGLSPGGVSFRVPLTRLAEHLGVGEAKYLPIVPHGATDALTVGKTKLFNALKDSKVGAALGEKMGRLPELNTPLLRRVIRQGTPEEALQAFHTLKAAPLLRDIPRGIEQQWVPKLAESLKGVSSEHMDDLRNALEGDAEAASRLAAAGVDAKPVRDVLEGVHADAVKEGLPLGKLSDYFPHQLTAAARKVVQSGEPMPSTRVAAEFARILKPGEKFLGVTLEKGSKDEIDKIGRETLGDKYVELFKGNPREVLPAYVKAVARRTGEAAFAKRLTEDGVVTEFGRPTIKAARESADQLAAHNAAQAIKESAVAVPTAPAVVEKASAPALNNTLREGEHYLRSLSDYSPNLYRETNAEGLQALASGSGMAGREVPFASHPELALGQGANKGIHVELDSRGVNGYLNRAGSKQTAYDLGTGAEFLGRNNRSYFDSLRKITVDKTLKATKSERGKLSGFLRSLEEDYGWSKVKNADGSSTWLHPDRVETPAARVTAAVGKVADTLTNPEAQQLAHPTVVQRGTTLVRDALQRLDSEAPATGGTVLGEHTGSSLMLKDAPQFVDDSLKIVRDWTKPTGMQKALRTYDKYLSLWKSYELLGPGKALRHQVAALWGANLGNVSVDNMARYLKLSRNVSKNGLEALSEGDREIFAEMQRRGVLHRTVTGDEFGAPEDKVRATLKSKANPLSTSFAPIQKNWELQGRAQDVVRGAMFYDAMKKGLSADMAAAKVKTFLFNASELSEFETKVMRRLIPFYTFMRTQFPLQLEQLARQPGKFTTFLHAADNLELGVPAPEGVEPQYLQDTMSIRLPFKFQGNQAYVSPDLPFARLGELFSGGGSFGPLPSTGPLSLDKVIANSSPVIKQALEGFANKQAWSNIPFTDKANPVPGTWAAIPGLMPVLDKLNLVERAKNDFTAPNGEKISKGDYVITDRRAYQLEGILPPLAQTRRLLPENEPSFDSREQSSRLAYLLGQNFRTLTPASQQGELLRRQEKLQALIKRLQNVGAIPRGKHKS